MERHEKIENVEDNELGTNWHDNVTLGAQCARSFHNILERLAEFQEMVGGRLGCIEMAKRRIELSALDVRSINNAPYCAAPQAREFEEAEINKMLRQNGREPARSEQASPIVFAPQKYS